MNVHKSGIEIPNIHIVDNKVPNYSEVYFFCPSILFAISQPTGFESLYECKEMSCVM